MRQSNTVRSHAEDKESDEEGQETGGPPQTKLICPQPPAAPSLCSANTTQKISISALTRFAP